MGSVEQNAPAERSRAWLPPLPASPVLELIPGAASATWRAGRELQGGSGLGRQRDVSAPDAPGFVCSKAQLSGGEGVLRQWGPSHDPSCHFLQGLGPDPHTLNYILDEYLLKLI